MMRKYLLIIICFFTLFQSCATVKSFFGKKSIIDPDDPNFLNNIQKLRSAYQDGDIQALEEMIQIYNDDNQHIKARIEAGRMLANTQHPMALNAIAKMVETTSAVDFSFLKSSIEMLALFRENPKASFAMVESMHVLEDRTNNLHLTIAENLYKVRTKDQILVLLDLYEIAKANMSRTEGMLTQILGGLESDQVIPVLTTIAKDPNVRLGIRNKAVQILGKKSPEDVATAFAELLGDPNTNLEVREFAINTMAGVKQENLILALLNTYNTGKGQYYTLLNTMLSALGEFNEPEVKLAVVEIASNSDYPLDIRKKAIDNLGAFKDPDVIPKILPILEKKENYVYYDNILDMVYMLGEEKIWAEQVRRMAFKASLNKREHE
jgi:HEAT repeat protein|tara:strand:- start:724 stop:1860 length:1137 start_codon:yes stop_codon:yes gene_type:complete